MRQMLMLFRMTSCFCAIACANVSAADVLLFNDSNDFRGCLDCSRFDSDAICNRFGNYGNRFSSDSIWNRFGAGSRFDSDSPFSRFGTGLKMVDRAGNFYGYLSMSIGGDIKMRRYLKDIWEKTNGDYGEMRDIFCDN